jgi:hypothetical protein
MRFTIEVEEGVQPISGRLHRLGDRPVEFTGMIELLAILGRVSDEARATRSPRTLSRTPAEPVALPSHVRSVRIKRS